MNGSKKDFPADMPILDGLAGAAAACGIRKKGRNDLTLVTLRSSRPMAAVFTSSRCPSAVIEWGRSVARLGKVRGVVVNSGNANVLTGKAGQAAVEATAREAAKALSCKPEEIFVASTGVVGEPLPVEKILQAIPDLARGQEGDFWQSSARAIMTTDMFPKGAWGKFSVGGKSFTIAGIAKGSGMVAPNMATVLVFLFTDAPLDSPGLDRALRSCLGRSFHAITIDGEMSPSDMILLASTGVSGGGEDSQAVLKAFVPCLLDVMQRLARSVARDGEGAKRLLTVRVVGARDEDIARRAAMAVANSLLVKTAVAGADPNWGRIIVKLGATDIAIDVEKIRLDIGGIPVMRQGERVADYDESAVAATMKGEDVLFEIDLGMGRGEFTVWSCDLTSDYARINADYRS